MTFIIQEFSTSEEHDAFTYIRIEIDLFSEFFAKY